MNRSVSENVNARLVRSTSSHAGRNFKQYKWYYSTASANGDMDLAPHDLHRFLRGYFDLKSGSRSGN
ncbi:hypothetical protein N7520_007114 [Penicillium odoratum]|uniref:uncharacterized protein n=1 Tax=Penicillium odoratum TaxID=1167516 RepID=UPI0025478640|nr:uncharacterized protein N7520_007114 [Penicillium odoratum]KAJ5759958.1 hypothetical protein N7520_007114 [Penicillium odoratum]